MKRFAITLVLVAAMAISNHSFAQLRLGVGASTRLSSAASVNTPSINNALHATAATSATAASNTAVAARSTSTTAGAEAKATTTEAKATSAEARSAAAQANADATSATSATVKASHQSASATADKAGQVKDNTPVNGSATTSANAGANTQSVHADGAVKVKATAN